MLSYSLRYGCIIIATFLFYILVMKVQHKTTRRDFYKAVFWSMNIGLILLVLQGDWKNPILMVSDAVDRITTMRNINLVPFRTIHLFFAYSNLDSIMINIVGNIIMFIPWGFGLAFLWEKNQNIGRMIIFSLAITASIEFIQLFIGRSTDIDDLLLNFCGSMIGYFIYTVLPLAFKRRVCYESD